MKTLITAALVVTVAVLGGCGGGVDPASLPSFGDEGGWRVAVSVDGDTLLRGGDGLIHASRGDKVTLHIVSFSPPSGAEGHCELWRDGAELAVDHEGRFLLSSRGRYTARGWADGFRPFQIIFAE